MIPKNVKLNRKDLSPRIVAILDKFSSDKIAYSTLKEGYLKLATHKLLQDSLKHDTFCDYFKVPRKLPTHLLKLYGINERELEHEFRQFHLKDFKIYNDPYYLTLMMAYLIGLDRDDGELRQYAIALIAPLIWNYYKLTYFPKVCDAEIARYVINYELKNNSTFKKFGSPFNYIMNLTIPQLEAKYPQEIASNPLDEYAGLKRIITTLRSRFNQLLKLISQRYYLAYNEGKREGTSTLYKKSYTDSNEMIEKNEHFSNLTEKISDKILKIASLKKRVISTDPIRSLLYNKFYVGNQVLQKIDKYLDDEDNHDDLKYMIELLIAGIKPKSEEEICSMNIEVLANRISSSKKDEYFIKLKALVNGINTTLFEEQNKSTQSEYRNRKILLLSILAYVKLLHCKRI